MPEGHDAMVVDQVARDSVADKVGTGSIEALDISEALQNSDMLPSSPDTPGALPAAGEDLSGVNKTDYSQQIKGNQSYYYWHGDAERRRLTGEKPVPLPTPHKLASHTATEKERRVKAVESFTFLDDGDVVKVYIALEGPLAAVGSSDVEAEFAERSLVVTILTPDCLHRLTCDRLAHSVDALRCKTTVTKSRKLVVKLHKRSPQDRWQKLRAS